MSFVRFAMKQGWNVSRVRDASQKRKQMSVEGVYFESCIPYTLDRNPMHQLNLYYPKHYIKEREGKLPVVIDIHGGGLMYGDKELNQRYCEYLASKGYCVMGMSYRLLPDTDLRGMVQDVFASLHWLEAYGEDRGFDLSKVLLTGDSAGGHLASLVMCIQQSPKLQKVYKVNKLKYDFSAVAICNGVCEFQDYFYYPEKINKKIDYEMVRMVLGKEKKHAAWEKYMNFSQVIQEVNVNSLPPILIIGTENDNYYHQTRLLMKTLKENGIKFEKIIWKKEQGPHLVHVFHVAHWEWMESRITNDKMLGFFEKNIKREKAY